MFISTTLPLSPCLGFIFVLGCTMPAIAAGQTARDTVPTGAAVTIVPGPSYSAGPLKRAILGAGWRDLWTTPVTAPLFDIDTYAGGLKVDKRGGGFQTVTLHLTEQNGWQEYRFRSVDKYPRLRLPPSLAGTVVGNIIQDQTGNLFPAAPLIVPPFVAAVGGLHVGADLFVMKDNPRLGQFRDPFAGMLGTVELKGEEAPDDKPGFAGSTKIKDTDGFFEDLEKSQAHRIDEREFLTARLLDFLINDTDRTPDNYDWARFGKKGDYLWRPISRDRDRAFTNGTGLLNSLIVRRIYPKFTTFNDEFEMHGLTQSSYVFDRRLLQRLTARDFAEVAASVQRAITDSVIDAALAHLPAEWRAQQPATISKIRSTLIVRRGGLADAARRFYEELAGEPDIHLTGDDERAEIVRHASGEVTVTVASTRDASTVAADVPTSDGAVRVMDGDVDTRTGRTLAPFYQRRFSPSETQEIRVYLGGGNDTAVVTGSRNDAIAIRIIGGEGNDVLADSTDGDDVSFYDAEGDNRFILGTATRVSERSWTGPEPIFGFTIGGAWRPDWGRKVGWRPIFGYDEAGGVVVGAGPRITSYGFRRLPYHWRADGALFVGTANGRLGLTGKLDHRAENSPLGVTIKGRATQLASFRFYGYGNDAPDIGSDLALVEQNLVSIEPAVIWNVGWRKRESKGAILHDFENQTGPAVARDTAPGRRAMVGELWAGPSFVWTDPEFANATALSALGLRGTSSFAIGGARAGMELDGTDRDGVPTSGWRAKADLSGYPLGIRQSPFGTASGVASTYVPLGWKESNLALRVGGAISGGKFPVQYASAIGGSGTLRGYRWERFAGDRAANASAELRVPVGTLNFLVRSNVGLIGLADVGRVWFGGESAGGWHSGVGGGVWFEVLGHAATVTYAHGEEHRFYLGTGLPF